MATPLDGADKEEDGVWKDLNDILNTVKTKRYVNECRAKVFHEHFFPKYTMAEVKNSVPVPRASGAATQRYLQHRTAVLFI